MTELMIPGFRAEADMEATKAWYKTAPVWNCPCRHCRNFVALAEAHQLPAEVMEILDKLSIPPEKATYVCELYHETKRLHYELTWHIAGALLERAEKPAKTPWGAWSLDPFDPGLFPHDTAAGFPEPCFMLHVDVWLPWVLHEPVAWGED